MKPTRLEFIGGGSRKFWEVSVRGSTMEVRFGRIGTDGQTKAKKFTSPSAAEAAAAKLTEQKTRSGYVRAGGKKTPGSAGAPTTAPSGSNGKLEKLIRALVDVKTEYWRVAFHEELVPTLGKPCSNKQISTLEHILKKPLPPSYRAFLEVCNGFSDFNGSKHVLSVEEQSSGWVKRRCKTINDLFFEDDPDASPFKAWGAIPVILGEDDHDYVVLDPRKVRTNGEMAFVSFDYSAEEDRYSTFTAYLEEDLAIERQTLAAEKKSRR